MTGQQMCETIAWVTGIDDPKAIWLSSPTGELWQVWEAFELACEAIRQMHRVGA